MARRANNSNQDLFEDPIFPPDVSSLAMDPEEKHPEFVRVVKSWKRPSQYCRDPVLFLDDPTGTDVQQGQLGDCWFLSACVVTALRPALIQKLFVEADSAKGRYVVRLYKYTKWVDVEIDDRIPCGQDGMPIFGRCRNIRETWVVLLEKAVAKLLGAYEALDGGYLEEGVVLLTGGRPERLYVNNWKGKKGALVNKVDRLWQKLNRYFNEHVMMGASISSGKEEANQATGLVAGHAYGITDIRQTRDGRYKLIKLRNPWACFEWKGAWSDTSRQWTQSYKQELNHQLKDDGCFWMSFDDFVRHFDKITCCRIFNDIIQSLPSAIPITEPIVFPNASWKRVKMEGAWNDQTAGGLANDFGYARNPHLKLSLAKASRAFLTISRPSIDSNSDGTYYRSSIGFAIQYGLSPTYKQVPRENNENCILQYPVYGRYNSLEVELEPGDYVITPCTMYSNRKSPFTLEVYAEQDFTLTTMDPETESAVREVPPSARGSAPVPGSSSQQQPASAGRTSAFNNSSSSMGSSARERANRAAFMTTYQFEFSRK